MTKISGIYIEAKIVVEDGSHRMEVASKKGDCLLSVDAVYVDLR